MCQESFKGVQRKFLGWFKEVTRVFQESFKGVSRMLQESFERVNWSFRWGSRVLKCSSMGV